MSDAFIDLQLHTNCSDGIWPPERLFAEVRAKKLERFSVTDHDTIGAYPVPADLAASCVPGLEVDTEHGGHTVHLLAYGITDPTCPLLSALNHQRDERVVRMKAIIERMRGLGVDVSYDDVRAQVVGAGSVGRPHLARALVSKGIVSNTQEAFDKYLADGEKGFVKLKRLTSADIIALVRQSGGIVVIAHPKRLREERHLAEIADLGVDGVEVVHPSADEEYQKMLYAFADSRGLLTTGGTDFHAPETHPLPGIMFPRERLQPFLDRVDRCLSGAA